MQVLYSIPNAHGFAGAVEKMSKEIRMRAERASQTTAFAVRARAKAGAPRDRGDLIANIEAQGKGLNWRVGILDVSIASRGGANRAHLNPSIYGVWYEYGFTRRQIDAHRFMGPASEAEEGPHLQRMTEAVNGAVDGAA